MALNAQSFRDALSGLGPEEPVFVNPPAEFGTWLADKRVPSDVIEFLLVTATAGDVPFPNGSGGMWTPRDIMELNEQESTILAGGLLAVGNSTNGDFIVIDLRDDQRQAGFVSHDLLWEGTTWADVREIFAPVADSLDEMLAGMSACHWAYLRGNALEADHYPWDYCDALSWRQEEAITSQRFRRQNDPPAPASMTQKPVCKIAHSQLLAGACPWCGCDLGISESTSPARPVWNIAAMTAALYDDDLEVRRMTVTNVLCHGGLDPESAIPLMSVAMADPAEDVRVQAEHALQHLGKELSASDARRLEGTDFDSSHELARRILLLGYYFLGQQQSPSAMQARHSHVLWLIEHAPRSKTAGMPEASLQRDEDDVSYEQARRLWLSQVDANPQDTDILGNAAHFFILRDMALSEKLLNTARSLDPRNPQWSERLGHLYHLRAGREHGHCRENSATALRELKAAEEVKLGVPWHAQEPDAAEQSAEDAVMTLLTRMHSLPKLAKTACDAGEFNEAQQYAHELLELSRSDRLPEFFRNDGNAIHDANAVLGRCALNEGNLESGKKYLLAAGMTTGSPQLDSFGPNMTLAKELLDRGEVDAVVEYFDLCRRFWKMGEIRLDEWTAEARQGFTPDFGANLRY